MKKLMVMIAAIATAFGLFADPLNNTWIGSEKDANTWSNGWTGVSITNGAATFADGQITLEASTLTRNLTDGTAKTCESNMFFDIDLDFKGQALDTLPTLDADAKLALFVLDPSDIEGAQSLDPKAPTALYALAKSDSADVQKLYRLDTSIDDFTNGLRKVTVKAYNNVMKSGVTANAGFVVYEKSSASLDTSTIAVIAKKYDISNEGVWTEDTSAYLANVDPKYSDKKDSILLSLVPTGSGADLTALDFVGNAKISTTTLTETRPEYIPEDLKQMLVVAEGITIGANNVLGEGNVVTNTGSFTVSKVGKDMFSLAIAGTDKECATIGESAGVWTVSINEKVLGATVTITAAKSAATVDIGGDKSWFASIADAVDAANEAEAAATLALTGNIQLTGEDALTIGNSNGGVTLDLNGNTITGSVEQTTVIKAAGTLTIDDTSLNKDGGIIAYDNGNAVKNNGTLLIKEGIYDGTITTGDDVVSTSLVGGSYSKAATEAKSTIEAFIDTAAYEVVDTVKSGYWTVQKKTAPTIEYVTVNITADADKVTYTAKTNGTAIVSGETVISNEIVTVVATPKTGYEYATTPSGWTLVDGAISNDVTAANAPTAITIPDPTKKQYTVSFTTNSVAWTSAQVEHGATLGAKVPELPVVTGYTFTWEDPAPTAETVITEAKTFNATSKINTYTITVPGVTGASVEVFTNGTVSIGTAAGGYVVPHGTSVTVTYTAESGYKIEGQTTFTTTATGDVKFPSDDDKPKPVAIYNIDIIPPDNGTLETSVTNNVAVGTAVTVTATPNTGYSLSTITTNGQTLAAVESVYSFAMPAKNVYVAAVFTANVYTVTYTMNDETFASAQVAYGSALGTVPELPDVTGHSVKWDDPKPTTATIITCATNFNATCAVNQYTLTINDENTHATVKVNGETPAAQYDFGTALTIVAAPESGYEYSSTGSYGNWTYTAGNLQLETNMVVGGVSVTVPAASASIVYRQITWEGVNVVVTNTTTETAITTTPINLPVDTVLTFYPTTGAITNVTVGGVKQNINDYTWSFTVAAADATIAVKAGKFTPNPSSGEITCDTAQQATYLAANITLHPEQYVQAPTGVTGDDATTYQSMFCATADGKTVTLKLTDEATNTLQTAVNTQVKTETTAAALVTPTATTAAITGATPGMFYWVEGAADVTSGSYFKAEAAQATTANKGSLSLTKPTSVEIGSTTKAFYKIGVDFKDPNK